MGVVGCVLDWAAGRLEPERFGDGNHDTVVAHLWQFGLSQTREQPRMRLGRQPWRQRRNCARTSDERAQQQRNSLAPHVR